MHGYHPLVSYLGLLAHWIFHDSMVQIGYVASGLLSCLSPGDIMIPDEGIIACLDG